MPPVALQLYSVRDLLESAFVKTIEAIAAMGYVGVETAFFSEQVTPAKAADIFKSLELTVIGAHCELPIGAQQGPVLALAEALETPRLIWHGWPQSPGYSTIDGTKRLAEQYNEANKIATANGYQFGIHNHWWEFEPIAEGQYPYQILLNEMDPTIFFEVDTYWVKTAGLDPVSVVTELVNRALLLHIKDGPAQQGHPMLPAGQGVMDIPALVQASDGQAEWLIVEFDEYAGDMLTAVEASYLYLTQHRLGTGAK